MQKYFFIIIIISIFFRAQVKAQDSLNVKTLNGYVKGITYEYKTQNQNLVLNAWYGIPYAQAPLENLRFKRPIPVNNWIGIIDTVFKRSPCKQSSTVGDEDCLFLNIVKPSNSSGNLPVMVITFYN